MRKFFKDHWLKLLLLAIVIALFYACFQSVQNVAHSSLWNKPIREITYGEAIGVLVFIWILFKA